MPAMVMFYGADKQEWKRTALQQIGCEITSCIETYVSQGQTITNVVWYAYKGTELIAIRYTTNGGEA